MFSLFILRIDTLNLIVLSQESILLGQTNDAIVRFSHTADLTADGVHLGGFQHTAGLGVHIDDVDLDGGMILGVDDSVAGRALPWAVQVNEFSGVVLHFW